MESVIVNVPARFAVVARGTGFFTTFVEKDGLKIMSHGPRQLVRFVAPEDVNVEFQFEKGVKVAHQVYDRRGVENVDTTPMEVPMKYKGVSTMRDVAIEVLQRYLAVSRDPGEYETLEEAMDFRPEGDIDDVITEAEKLFRRGLQPVNPLNPLPKPGKRPKKAAGRMEDEEPTPPPEPPGKPAGDDPDPDSGEE